MMRALGAITALLLSAYVVYAFIQFQQSDAALPLADKSIASSPAPKGVLVSADAPATPPVATLAPPTSLKIVQWLKVDDARLDESSGVCFSKRFSGSLWTHNDSGDTARVFLIGPGGTVRAEVPLQGATNRDWEDIAYAKGWVYCADIGDNDAKYSGLTVYRFRESAVQLDKADAKRHLCPPVACEKSTLAYPDGPRDAETLLVRPDGVLMIASKGFAGSTIYATPQPFKAGASMILQPVGQFVFPTDEGWRGTLATSGDLAPDGKHVVIMTYKRLYQWTLPAGKDAWHKVWQTTPRSYLLPDLRQAEGVCYAPDGRSWWITSEKSPMPLLQVAP